MTFKLVWSKEMEGKLAEWFQVGNKDIGGPGTHVELVNALAPLIAKQVAEECAKISEEYTDKYYISEPPSTNIASAIRTHFNLDATRPEDVKHE